MKFDIYFFKVLAVLSLLIFTSVPNVSATEDTEPMKNRYLSLGGGKFTPSDGESGTAFLGQFMNKNGQKRFGVEVEYRDFEATLFEVPKIDTQSFVVRGVGQYFFRSEGISPYIGGGFGISVNTIDADKIEQARSQGRSQAIVVSEVGIGFGLMGLVGIEAPVTPNFLLFAEGRVSGDYQLTQTKNLNTSGEDEIEVENLGGVTILGGIRFQF